MKIKIISQEENPLNLSMCIREAYIGKTDREIAELRLRYKEYEDCIRTFSENAPPERAFQAVCAAMREAFNDGAEKKDPDLVYCPWLCWAFEALENAAEEISKSLAGKGSSREETHRSAFVIDNLCRWFVDFGRSLVRYLREVYPDAPNSSCKFVREISARLGFFFKVHKKLMLEYQEVLEFMFQFEDIRFPCFKKGVFRGLIGACMTADWPRMGNKKDKVFAEFKSRSELCSLMGKGMPSEEEEAKLRKEIDEENAVLDLDAALAAATRFFEDKNWYKRPDLEIAIRRICLKAAQIARKAKDYSGYYRGKSSHRPILLLSEEFAEGRLEDFIPLVNSFVKELIATMRDKNGEVECFSFLRPALSDFHAVIGALFHNLIALPHDRHLSAARRKFRAWYKVLVCIIRESMDASSYIESLVSMTDSFLEEMATAGDFLSELESQVSARIKVETPAAPSEISGFEAGQKGCHKRPVAYDLTEESIEKIITGVAGSIREKTLPARVEELSPKATSQIKGAVHAKMPERGYFSGPILCALFEVSENTPANWVKGKGTPEGFIEAYRKRDRAAMQDCAEKYKASRKLADAMNTKHVKHGISEEEIFKEGGNPWGKPQ